MDINIKVFRADLVLPIIHITAIIFVIVVQICISNIYYFLKKDIKEGMKTESRFDLFFKKFQLYQIKFFLFFLAGIFSGILLQNQSLKLNHPLLDICFAGIYALSILVFINFFYISYRFFLSKKAYKKKDIVSTKENLNIIFFYFLPLNIALSFILIYLEIIIESF